jgi:uncharacterized protein (TIGR00369 family)
LPPDQPSPLFDHVRPIFAGANFIAHLGISLDAVGEGWCEASMLVRPEHLQQHGYAHAGVIATLADHTAGGAARAATTPGWDVVTIEFKINYLRPAVGHRLVARGQTLRAGARVIVAEADVYAVDDSGRILVAKYLSSLARVPQRPSPGGDPPV